MLPEPVFEPEPDAETAEPDVAGEEDELLMDREARRSEMILATMGDGSLADSD